MKNHRLHNTYLAWVLPLLALIAMVILVLPALGNDQPQAIAGLVGTPSYFPFIIKEFTPTPIPTATATPLPTPTATPTVAPVPQFVTNITTANAECPGAVGFNSLSGNIYVLNEYSSNVNIFRDRALINTIHIPPTLPDDPAGSWPVAFAADNDSNEVYIAAVHAGVARIKGTNLISVGERYYEPHGVVVNPTNGYTYAPDLNRAMQVFNGSTLVTNIVFEMSPETDAWFVDAVVDPNTGYVYTAGVEGIMFVIDGTTVIDSYRLGWRVIDIAIDPVRGYIYAAHSGKNADYNNNISIFNINTQSVTRRNTASFSRHVAVDPNSGLVYVTNPGLEDDLDDDTVTLLHGSTVEGNVTVGNMPWGVEVNPNSGYAFVTNRKDNSVTILRNGDYIDTIPVQGADPFAVGVDTNTNDIYIANRGREFLDPWGYCNNASVTILR